MPLGLGGAMLSMRKIQWIVLPALCSCSPGHEKAQFGMDRFRTIGHTQFTEARLHSLAWEFDTPIALGQDLRTAAKHMRKHRPPGVDAVVMSVKTQGPDFQSSVPWARITIAYAQALQLSQADNPLRLVTRIQFASRLTQEAAKRYCIDPLPRIEAGTFCSSARAGNDVSPPPTPERRTPTF